VLYTGVTNNVLNRENQHKSKISKKSFTNRYNINRVVYYETFTDINNAIQREKQIKNLVRRKKIELIESINKNWDDIVHKMRE